MKTTFLMLIIFATVSAYGQDNNANCFSDPLSLTGNNKEVTLDKSPVVTKNSNVYVYYHRKKMKGYNATKDFPDVPDPNASKPVLISCGETQQVVPETYKVTVTTPQSNVVACPDSSLTLTTNINVEKQSSFTGNYPSSKNVYKKVSKRTYKKVARKARHSMKKEDKVVSNTGVRPTIPQ
jgi:hypothetical protein